MAILLEKYLHVTQYYNCHRSIMAQKASIPQDAVCVSYTIQHNLF